MFPDVFCCFFLFSALSFWILRRNRNVFRYLFSEISQVDSPTPPSNFSLCLCTIFQLEDLSCTHWPNHSFPEKMMLHKEKRTKVESQRTFTREPKKKRTKSLNVEWSLEFSVKSAWFAGFLSFFVLTRQHQPFSPKITDDQVPSRYCLKSAWIVGGIGLPAIGSGLYPIRSWITSRLLLVGAFGTGSTVSDRFPENNRTDKRSLDKILRNPSQFKKGKVRF